MKFNIGNPTNKIKCDVNTDGWKEIKNVSNFFMFKIVILLIGIVISILFYQFIKDIIALEDIIIKFKNRNWYLFLIIIFLHEFTHVIIFPDFGLSEKTIIGLWPKKFVFYSFYNGILKRNRLLFAMLNPLIFLTILPLVLIYTFKIKSMFLVTLVLLNPILGVGDIFYSILVVKQIPKEALVFNDISKIFWKKA